MSGSKIDAFGTVYRSWWVASVLLATVAYFAHVALPHHQSVGLGLLVNVVVLASWTLMGVVSPWLVSEA